MISLKSIFGRKKEETLIQFVERQRTSDELRATAYHEAGHALVTVLRPSLTDLKSVTIKFNGTQMGNVECSIPKNPRPLTKKALENAIMQDLAGRASEEVVFGKAEIGTYEGDYKRASMTIDTLIEQGLIESRPNIHEDILEEMLCATKNLLEENRHILDQITAKLLARKTIPAKAVQKIIREHTL